ncbi:mitochondrial ribosomal subunit protein-domain-containing protein [Tricharina praecox]|uniref:mitochondrial ribosomal subunit protein-domain-containing protein n=1 Tax=Tricharina praecox TaxID=43433 RepID=UPI00222009D5|nr:mitochondrial ribosomal subunit protein-domain-containing protein [Tricharina praecox]KAI5855867.1 mitochondrial ribosomal subunit protein-domain-containing protein [Tricharina praecox]
MMLSQFRTLGRTAARSCQNALAVRPHTVAKFVAAPVVPRRGMSDAPPTSSSTSTSEPDVVETSRRQQQIIDDDDPLDDDRQWDFDDISSLGHAEIDTHREARHYARVAAYEMPYLAQLAKPFVPPTDAQPLRFRYTTYMGEDHPAESKVVLEFSPADLGLDIGQQAKLVKLVGRRYHPGKRIVKMSCEMFEHQAQNKRYLSDLLDKLIVEAKDATDTFEDIPVDFRHIKAKPMIARRPVKSFPLEWVDAAIQREYERHEKIGSPLADWVGGAEESIKERKDKQAERAAARHIARQKYGERLKKRNLVAEESS